MPVKSTSMLFSITHISTNDVEKNGYDITPIADTFIIAMNLYSDKVKSVGEIKDGDVIAIPDDASNGGRALKVLASAG